MAHLSVKCPDVPRGCRRRRAEHAAVDDLVPAAEAQRRCSRQTATCRLPRTRSSVRPTAATVERVHTTTGKDLHHVVASTRIRIQQQTERILPQILEETRSSATRCLSLSISSLLFFVPTSFLPHRALRVWTHTHRRDHLTVHIMLRPILSTSIAYNAYAAADADLPPTATNGVILLTY